MNVFFKVIRIPSIYDSYSSYCYKYWDFKYNHIGGSLGFRKNMFWKILPILHVVEKGHGQTFAQILHLLRLSSLCYLSHYIRIRMEQTNDNLQLLPQHSLKHLPAFIHFEPQQSIFIDIMLNHHSYKGCQFPCVKCVVILLYILFLKSPTL